MRLNLSTLTMNGSGILIKKLEEYRDCFDEIFVCDGALGDSDNRYEYPEFVTVFDMPWDDNYVDRYRKTFDSSLDGDWVLHLDDDEILSPELLAFLKQRKFVGDLYKIPCILHIDNKSVEPDPPETYQDRMWTKSILYRKCDNVDFRFFGSHVIPFLKSGTAKYLPCPYFHMKTLASFVMNDCLQAFVLPQGQGYSPIEAARFKILTSIYKNSLEFKQSIVDGEWSPSLQSFAWSKRRMKERPISRLAWSYFILYGNEMPEEDDFMSWDNVKNFIL